MTELCGERIRSLAEVRSLKRSCTSGYAAFLTQHLHNPLTKRVVFYAAALISATSRFGSNGLRRNAVTWPSLTTSRMPG